MNILQNRHEACPDCVLKKSILLAINEQNNLNQTKRTISPREPRETGESSDQLWPLICSLSSMTL